jgi:cell division protein FtsB
MLITIGITRVVAASEYPNRQGAELLKQAGVMLEVRTQVARPPVVCLCGSTKFKAEFEEAERTETRAGRIVLTVGFFGHADGLVFTPEQKAALDELHKRKIDLADEVLVLNVGGYIGNSTRSEIDYAVQRGKVVRYLEAA